MGVDILPGQLGIDDVVAACALALALALVVERALELLKSVYDLVDSRAHLAAFWTRRALVLRDFVQARLRGLEFVTPSAMSDFLNKVSEMLLGPDQGYSGTVPTIAGDLVRAAVVRIAAKVVGAVIGVALALAFDVDVPSMFQQTSGVPHVIGIVATGIAIGLGAGPVHKIIVALEEHRDKKSAARAAEAPNAG